MRGKAYYISPAGKLVDIPGYHAKAMISKPEKFGLTRKEIEAAYKKYNEKMGIEGKAREELIKSILDKGWIRIREYPNMYWSVQARQMKKREMDRIQRWATVELKKNQSDAWMPVKIACLNGYVNKKHTLRDISRDLLYMDSEIEPGYIRYWLEEALIDDVSPEDDQILARVGGFHPPWSHTEGPVVFKSKGV